MYKATLLTSFFLLTPLLLIVCIVFFTFLSYKTSPENTSFLFTQGKNVAYAALPKTQQNMQVSVKNADARVEKVRQFLSLYGSPLEPFAEHIVKASDFYGIDFRLVPAIAMQESTLCKKAPKGTYNCWGFGIYGKKVTRFTSYSEGISVVSKTLAKRYTQQGLDTPGEIMTRYTPSNDGTWANNVAMFMNQLQ